MNVWKQRRQPGVTVVHEIAGRVRLRLGWLNGDKRSAEHIVTQLQQQAGVRRARVNLACASVIVVYDAARISLEVLCMALQRPVGFNQTSALSLREPQWRSQRMSALLSVIVGGVGLLLAFGAPAAPLTLAVIVASAVPIASRAFTDARNRKLSADTLDTLALAVLIAQRSMLPAALSSFLIAGGEYIRALTARRSRRAVDELIRSTSSYAWVLRGGRAQRIPADEVAVGEIVVAAHGERIAVDGEVVAGKAAVDEKFLTGEARPILKQTGDAVYASTIVADGELSIRARKTGKQTRARRIVEILESAPAHDTAIGNYAVRFADRFVLPVLLLAGLTYLLTRNLTRAVSVIVFDFATGIRISVPTTVLAGMSAAVRRNVLIKGGRAIEKLAHIDAILFDKTGTLTSGMPVVTHVQPLRREVSEGDLLMITAAAEHRLSHPAAQAIVAEAQRRGVSFPDRAASRYFIGSGIEARIDGSTVLVGSESFLLDRGIAIPSFALETAQKSGEAGVSTVFAARDDRAIGFISYADVPRPEAYEVLARLRAMGITHVVMITGDQREVADAVAGHLGIDHVEAEIFPERKSAIVRALQARGHTVAVVGDGINDSPALAYADVSLSLTSGTEIARETADIVLHGSLHGIVDAITLARDVMRIIRQDIAIVGVSNGIGVVLAALGLINPTLATAINNGSGVAAALNSLRPALPKHDDAGKRLSLASAEPVPAFATA